MNNDKKPTYSYLLTFAVLTAIVLLPEPAFAQNGTLFNSGTNFLTSLMNILNGTWARIIGIIAVCCLGIAWMAGRIAWSMAISVIGGIILIFGAPAIVDSISASL